MKDGSRIPVVVSGARTPIGRYLGGLSPKTAPELGAVAVSAAVARAGIDVAHIDEVILGNVLPAGIGRRRSSAMALANSAAGATAGPITNTHTSR